MTFALWLLAALVVLVVSLVAVLPRLPRRHGPSVPEVRARAAYSRLGYCVETLPSGVPSEHVRRASERWNTAGQILADASSAEEYALAYRTAEDGLGEVSRACAALGLPDPTS